MKKAICVLTNNQKGISGVIKFKEISRNKLEIDLDIKGLTPDITDFIFIIKAILLRLQFIVFTL